MIINPIAEISPIIWIQLINLLHSPDSHDSMTSKTPPTLNFPDPSQHLLPQPSAAPHILPTTMAANKVWETDKTSQQKDMENIELQDYWKRTFSSSTADDRV